MTEKEETKGRGDTLRKHSVSARAAATPGQEQGRFGGVGVLKLKRGVQGEELGPGLLRRGAAQLAWHI